jgi:hypothetical protein
MKKIIFLADLYSKDYAGGAELTTDAIISYAPKSIEIEKKYCQNLTEKDVLENKNADWIVCNFSSLKDELKILLCKNINYSIIEYDYKYCIYRSPEKHLAVTGKECDCHISSSGKINKAFYGYANHIWFMSEKQKQIYLNKLTLLKPKNTSTLNSVFNEGNLRFMYSISNNPKDEKYIILGSKSWIKGTEDNINFAKVNNLEYEVVSGLPYHEMLIKLSTSKGLIFRPLGADTCPRIVMEAKILGCDLKLNDYVQHKDEDWFVTPENIGAHIKNQMVNFWSRYA